MNLDDLELETIHDNPQLEKLIDEHGIYLIDHIQVNVDPEDMISDVKAAMKGAKRGEKIFVFEFGEKWLIPAKSEEDAVKRVKSLITNKKTKADLRWREKSPAHIKALKHQKGEN